MNTITARLTATLQGHTASARCVAFSPDGKTLASVGNDGTIRLWDLKSLKQRKTANGRAKMNAVAFSPDGKLLATSDTSGRTRLWHLRKGELLWSKKASFPGLDCSTCVAFAPDGESVAASSFGIRLLNVETGKDRVKFPDIRDTVASVAFSPDGTTLVSATVESGEINLWDTATAQQKQSLKGHAVQYEGRNTSERFGAWRSPQTAKPLPLAVTTRLSSSGMQPRETNCVSCKDTTAVSFLRTILSVKRRGRPHDPGRRTTCPAWLPPSRTLDRPRFRYVTRFAFAQLS